MYIELGIIFLIFVLSYLLILKNFKISIYLLIILSVLVHKELFSFFRWDLMPVRAFMLGLLCAGITHLYFWAFSSLKSKRIQNIENIRDPFLITLFLLWIVRGISIYFSRNIEASILLFGFFTTILFLVFYLVNYLKKDPDQILKYLKFYVFVSFILTIFGYFQYLLYWKTGIIIGAFWNIPGNISRVGATFWDVNHYAALLAALIPISSVLVLISKKIKHKFVYTLVSLSLVITLFLTNSRSAWMMEATALLVFSILFLVKKFGYKSLILLATFLILISSIGAFEYSQKDSLFRAKVKQYFHYRMDSFDAHFLLLQGAIQIFEKYPIIGGGYGGFFEHFSETKVAAEFFGRDPAAFSTRFPAHTLWGELLAETGIIGFSLWVFLSFILLFSLLKVVSNSKNNEKFLLSSAMFSVIIGWFVAGIFYSYNTEFFWILYTLFFMYGVSNFQDSYSLESLFKFVSSLKKFPYIVLLLLSASLVFIGLGNYHLIPWDESIYAKIAKNMVVNNEYIVQYWKPGVVWYEKPPLFMWSMSFTMSLLGFTSFAAKLPSAIFGIGTVLVTYLFAQYLFKSKTTAFLSGLSLLTTVQFLYYSRQAMTDVTNTFFITLSLYLYWLSRGHEKKGFNFRLVLSGIFIGLAVLTKGVIGLIPLVVIGIFELFLLLTSKQIFNKQLFYKYLYIIVPAFLVFLPWHIIMYQKFGLDFINNYLGYHVISRATEAIENKGQPWWWYFIVLKISMRLWFVVLVLGIPWYLSNLYKYFNFKFKLVDTILSKFKFNIDTDATGKWLLLFIWSLFTFTLFSVSKSKLAWYIMPIYPVLSIFVGSFISHVLETLLVKFHANVLVFRFLSIIIITITSIMYLFFNRSLAYPGDLTGPQVHMMTLKDTILGTDSKFYLDRIELPLAMFYTDSPFEIIDYQPEKGRTPKVLYEQDMIVLAKKGRADLVISGMRAQKKVLGSEGDWELFYYPSEYSIDKDALNFVQSKILNPLTPTSDYNYLKSQENAILRKMEQSKGIVMYYVPNVSPIK